MAGHLGRVRGGWDRDNDRSAPSATITKPSKSRDGQTTMTVTVPQDSNKRKVQSNEEAPQSKCVKYHDQGVQTSF